MVTTPFVCLLDVRQRVVGFGLLSWRTKKNKMKQGNPTAHQMDKIMLLTHRFRKGESWWRSRFSLPQSRYYIFLRELWGWFRLFARRSRKKSKRKRNSQKPQFLSAKKKSSRRKRSKGNERRRRRECLNSWESKIRLKQQQQVIPLEQ